MLAALFTGSDTVEMENVNHERFSAARSALNEGLVDAYKDKTFVTNLGWAWMGLILLLAAILLVATAIVFSDFDATSTERTFPAVGLGFMLAALLAALLAVWRRRKGWAFGLLIAALVSIGIFFLGVSFVGIANAEPFATFGWMLAPLLALPLVFSAFAWMSAPTAEGAR